MQHVMRLLDRSLDRILQEGEACVRLGGESFVIRRAFVEDLRSQDQRRRIAHLNRPLLVLHSPRDEVVGIESAAAIFQAARHPKSFVSLDTADHLLTQVVDAEYAATIIAAWISRFVPVIDPTSGYTKDTQARAG
jgi:uncharacterized protein